MVCGLTNQDVIPYMSQFYFAKNSNFNKATLSLDIYPARTCASWGNGYLSLIFENMKQVLNLKIESLLALCTFVSVVPVKPWRKSVWADLMYLCWVESPQSCLNYPTCLLVGPVCKMEMER